MTDNDDQEAYCPTTDSVVGFDCTESNGGNSNNFQTAESDYVAMQANNSISPMSGSTTESSDISSGKEVATNPLTIGKNHTHITNTNIPNLQREASMMEIASAAKDKDESSGIITAFHPEVLQQFCNYVHENYNPCFNLDKFNTHLIIVNEMWLHRSLLSKAVESIGQWHGFSSKM